MNNIAEIACRFLYKTKEEVGICKSKEWCAEFVSIVLEKSNIKGTKPNSISCNDLIAQMRNSEFWYEPDDTPEPGDIIFFDWDKEHDACKGKPIDHVGIVTTYQNGYVTYIDGNSGDGTRVAIHTMPISALKFSGLYQDYYMRYREIKQTEETNCCKKDVSSILKCIDKINTETETMKKILQNWSE